DRISEYVNGSLYMTSDDPLRLQEAIEEYMINTETGFSVYNVYLNRQKQEQLLLLMSVFTYGFMILITAICIANILNTISTSIALRKREFAMLKSVGMTPKSFNRMIYFESIFYGIKALLIGLPVSFAVMYLMFNVLGGMFDYAFTVPWASVAVVIVSVFLIVGVAMLYSSAKVKKENIIDVLKQEII
ncbi:MAG TPA: ABC transporter permease, partial [Thermoclostridium caenicola]|nr:ABC transporter permease [Thermoclostridium caenicola]